MRNVFAVSFHFLVFISVYSQEGALAALTNSDCMLSGSASVLVYDLDNEKDLYSFDENRALPTASIQKLLTTAAALYEKGSHFRYKTLIGYTGKIEEGILKGDLIIMGSGDPSLGSEYFPETPSMEALAKEATAKLNGIGVKRILGDIVLDNHLLKGQAVPGGWPWADLGNYYGAGHWALNIHDNEYKLFFQQNEKVGAPVSMVRTEPEVPDFEIISEVTTGPKGSGDRAYIYAAPYGKKGVVRGTIPPGRGEFSVRGSLPDPPEFFGRFLMRELSREGIGIQGEIKTVTHAFFQVMPLVVWESPELKEIVKITNHHSVNMYAEALMRLICGEETDSHFECGREKLVDFWKRKGMDPDRFFSTDGSGLSPRNASSARAFVQALRAVYAEKNWYEVLSASLPMMGKEGTLQYMLRAYKGTGTIYAKSGYIGRQRSYTGYIHTESGRHLAFCVILDNYGCSDLMMRRRIEDFLISLLKK